MPPAWAQTSENDVLRNEDEAYARKLNKVWRACHPDPV
nr:alpha/beta hydrolase fold domain-containing protein [Parapedobacter indicus]